MKAVFGTISLCLSFLFLFGCLPKRDSVYPTKSPLISSISHEKPGSWLPYKGTAKAVVLVAHGFNMSLKSMSPHAESIRDAGFDVFKVALSGHRGVSGEINQVSAEQWVNESYEAYQLARTRADSKGIPLYLFGYSMGGMLQFGLLGHKDLNVRYEKAVLLAPALAMHSYIQGVKVFFPFGSDFELPTLTNPYYMANTGLPVAAFSAFMKSLDNFYKIDQSRLNIPTLVILNKFDELISARKIRALARKNNYTNWAIRQWKHGSVRMTGPMNHLMVDEWSLGKKGWQEMTEQINEYFTKGT